MPRLMEEKTITETRKVVVITILCQFCDRQLEASHKNVQRVTMKLESAADINDGGGWSK